ncbi:MAG: type II toxin-antitoxin system VapC family toxin [Candidatus Bathyarchaeia archaeon]
MKIFLDSSYLIYLRYSESDEIFNYVTNFLKEAVKRRDRLFINMVVIDEVLWILTRKYKIALVEVFELIDRLMPLLDVIPIDYTDYNAMKKTMVNHGLKPSDALHVSSMTKAGIKQIVSEDGEFDKIPGIRRIWLNTKTTSTCKPSDGS